MTDINRRDTSEISELSRAVFENPQVFVDRAESRFRDQLRGMTEKVATSGSHIVLLCGPSSSGKTTTANLLVSDLSALGRRAVRISLDDFYRNRDVMPLWHQRQYPDAGGPCRIPHLRFFRRQALPPLPPHGVR